VVTAAIEVARTDRWLPFSDPAGRIRLYCLPHAGAAASTFRPWVGRLAGVAVCPLQLPGRETRADDAPYVRMGPLVEELAQVVLEDAQGGPYALYGHSIGALIGFEMMHEIRRLGGPQPVQFLLSACSAPHLAEPDVRFTGTDLTDEQVFGLLRLLGGTPESVLAHPFFLRTVLPVVRADLTVKNTYDYRQRQPLDVPITTFAGTDDPRASVESIAAWREQTAGRFQAYTLDGGHFAALEQLNVTLGHLDRVLSPWSRTT
jgi:surfactin synthase thioesterase subunit